jgi:hypothetical protein
MNWGRDHKLGFVLCLGLGLGLRFGACVFVEGSRRGRCGWPYGVAVPCDFSFLFFAPGSGPLSDSN